MSKEISKEGLEKAILFLNGMAYGAEKNMRLCNRDFETWEYFGTNVDDAYQGGRDDGEQALACKVLDLLYSGGNEAEGDKA